MPLIPYQTFRLETPISPDEVIARLEAAVEPFRWFRLPWPAEGHRTFQGEVRTDGFRIVRIIHYRNSFIPVIRGHVYPTADGARVEGTMAMYPAIVAFMALWMTGVGLGCVAVLAVLLGGAWNPALLIPFGMLLFGWAMTAVSFTLEARVSLRRLRAIISADSESPVSSRHHETAK